MSERSTDQLNYECERIANECDSLLDSVFHVEVSIDHLQMSAGSLQAQMALLGQGQAQVALQHKALKKKIFWANLHPTVLMGRLGHSVGTLWRRSTSQPVQQAPQEVGARH